VRCELDNRTGQAGRRGKAIIEGSNMRIRIIQPQEIAPLAMIYVDTFKATHTGIVSEKFLQALSYESAQLRLEGIFNKQERRPFCYVCDSQGAVLPYSMVDNSAASETT
jgi:hypothetical protein